MTTTAPWADSAIDLDTDLVDLTGISLRALRRIDDSHLTIAIKQTIYDAVGDNAAAIQDQRE